MGANNTTASWIRQREGTLIQDLQRKGGELDADNNAQAVGVSAGPKGAITLTTKKQQKVQQPGQQFQSVTFSGAKSARKCVR